MYNIANKQYKEIVEFLSDYIVSRETQDLRTFNRVRRARILMRSLKKKNPV